MRNRLIPCNLPFIGLMRVGYQPRLAIGHALWRNRKCIGAIQIGIAANRRHRRSAVFRLWLAFGKCSDCPVQPVKEGRAQHKASDDVFSGHGKQLRQPHFARMLGHIIVQTSGIGLTDRPNLRRQFHIMLLGRFARTQQVHDIIDLCAIGTGERSIATTRHGNDIFYGRKIIFGMGVSKAVSGVGIGLAIDMRHPKFVAHDFDIICAFWRFISGCRQRFPKRACTRNNTHKRQRRP